MCTVMTKKEKGELSLRNEYDKNNVGRKLRRLYHRYAIK